MASRVDVVFSAETGQYIANVDGATKAVAKSAEAVAAAKNRILESFRMQTQAAKDVGASHQELQAIQQRASQMMANVQEKNADRIVNSLNRISERNKRVAQELANLNSISPLGSSHGVEVSERMATSAAVRLGEGNMGIRPVENFLASIPGVGQAMQSLFPLIGAAGLAGMLVDMGVKGYDAFEKVRHAAQDTQRAFDEVHSKDQLIIDDLEIQNQKIQDQIAKLSGHPNNGLATALLEAKKMADELLKSLQADRKELEGIFKEHHVGALQSFFTGVAGTAGQETGLLKDFDALSQKLQDAQTKFESDTAGVTDNNKLKQATDRRNKAVSDAFDSQITTLKSKAAELQKAQDASRYSQRSSDAAAAMGVAMIAPSDGVVNNSARIAELQNVIKKLEDRKRIEMLDESIYAGNQQLGTVKQGKELSTAADKEAAKRFKALEGQVVEMERNGAAPKAIYDFWERNKTAFVEGSEQFNAVLEKQYTIGKAAAEKVARALAEARAGNMVTASDLLTGRKEAKPDGGEDAAARAMHAITEMRNLQRKFEDQAASEVARQKGQRDEAALNIARAQGAVSPHEYAVQMANIHAQLYSAEQDALKKRLDDANASGSMADINQAKLAITKSQADRTVQIMQDAANTASTTWRGALHDANAAWVQDAEDSAKKVVQFYHEALAGLNDNLANAMVGDKTNWSGMFRGLGKTLAKDGLEKAEAPILKMFGIEGKPDGSDSKPFTVKIAGGGGSFSSGLSKGLSGLFSKSGDDSSDDSGDGGSHGFWSTAVGFVGSLFGGNKALGGPVKAGWRYRVGELGHEDFVAPTNGYIVPHSQTSSNGASYTINVANGVTPEQMHMHVQSALRQFHPQVVRDSVAAGRDMQLRTPSSHH